MMLNTSIQRGPRPVAFLGLCWYREFSAQIGNGSRMGRVR